MASTIPIAVEKLLESEVQEIARDGQETYAPQLSMSEKLAQLAHKIDFFQTKDEQVEENEDSGVDSAEEKSDKPLFQPSLWPWDSVRNKLRNALTDLCVLADVLSVARERKYLLLDPVSQGEAPARPTVRLLTKRKNLAEASRILLLGAQDMSGGLRDQHENLTQKDFHSELMSLRQRWRLKKSGNLILGDLSYKTAGSKFWHTGAFEVRKESRGEDHAETTNSVDVNISSDLNGISEVQVRIVNEEFAVDARISDRVNPPSLPQAATSWHRKLCISQKNLFCKELFAQLAHESYHGKGSTTQVVGNVIQTEIFPQTKMCITHVHLSEEECEDNMNWDEQTNFDVLDFSIQTLLRQQHRASSVYDTPRPITTAVAMKGSKKQRVAGPSCMILQDFEKLNTSRRLLDKLTDIAKHHVLTKRVCRVIQDLADDIQDPLLSCHWSSLSTETSSFATVSIGLENGAERSCLAVKVGTDTVHVTQSDGIGLTFSGDIQELKLMLRNQVQLFMLDISRKIGLRLGWSVKVNTCLRPTGDSANKEYIVGILLCCREKEREVMIEISPPSVIGVKVKSPQYGDPPPKILENEPMWSSVSRKYHPLNYEKIPGRTYWDKLTIILLAS